MDAAPSSPEVVSAQCAFNGVTAPISDKGDTIVGTESSIESTVSTNRDVEGSDDRHGVVESMGIFTGDGCAVEEV